MGLAVGGFSEKVIQARLWDHYFQVHPFIFHNTYFFGPEDGSYKVESDAVHFLENGKCWEVEIKVRAFDFFDDMKKVDKHKDLKAGVNCANYFYYAAPFDMIDVKDLPPYAGLIEVSEAKIRIKKRAPELHKNLYNPAYYFNRLYLKYRDMINKDMNKVLADFKLKRMNKSAYKKKKFTPKSKHQAEKRFLED